MNANLNKRVRIAHIGNLSEAPGETKEQHDEVYDVIRKTLDNVNKTEKTILSYQQLQEFKKAISQHNGKTNNCSSILTNRKKKRNTSKQPKPFLPEKVFPLMKECQKNWKFLKKNRCIPKPRAHVNITSTPLQKPRDNVISRPPPKPRNHVNATPSPSFKPAQSVKAFTSEPNSNKYCNNSQLPNLKVTEQSFKENNIEEFEHRKQQIECEEQTLNNSDLDYDSEYEKFVQKHKPAKRKAKFSSKSNKSSRIHKVKKSKQRKNCKINVDEKISKITSKPLSDTDDCSETEMKISNKNNLRNKHTQSAKPKQDFTKKSKKNIVQKNNESYYNLKHTFDASAHCDSSDFSEYEDMIADSSSEENLNDNRNNTKHSETENLILKCKIPCYVLMERDSIIDQMAIFLHNDNHSVMNQLIPSTCVTDEDDCIIIEESVKSVLQNSEALEFPSTSRCNSNYNASEKLSNAKLESMLPNTSSCEQNQYASTGERIFNQDTQIQQASEISFSSKTTASSNSYSLSNDTDNSFPKILSKDLNGMQYSVDKNVNSSETEDCIIICENTGYNSSQKESSRTNDAENSLGTFKEHLNVLNRKMISIASNPRTHQMILDKNIEESTLNVKILSVETLDKTKASEIIDLSDENEEIKFESVYSDIEIICLDSPSLSAQNVSEKVTKVHVSENNLHMKEIVKELGSETPDKTDSHVKTNIYCSNELPKSGGKDNELLERNLKTNRNKQKEISKTSDKVSDVKSDNAKIFELLSSIDFDCIKKVLNSTPSIDMNKMENVNDSLIEISKPCESHVKSNKSIDSYSMKNPKVLIDSNFIKDQPTTNENVSANCVKITVDEILEIDSLRKYPEHSLKKDFTLPKENKIKCSIRNESNRQSSSSVPEFSKNIEKEGSNLKDAINLQSNNLYSDDECQIILHKSSTGTSSTSSENSFNNHIQLKEDNVTCLINKSHKIPVDCKSSETTIISSQNADINVSQASSFNKVVEQKVSSFEVSKKHSEISKLKHESFLLPENTKLENNAKIEKDNVLDELDLIATKSIFNIDENKRPTIMPLLNLYKSEYKKYKAIKCTEKNVSAGLKLLEENQAKKLKHISSSIKNLVKHDSCFEKVFHKCENFQIDSKFDLKNEKKDLREKIPSFMSETNLSFSEDIKNENCGSDESIKIFHPSVVESAAEVVRTKSSGSSKDLEVYNHLINSICAECGKQALAACSGCAKVYYCSEDCGIVNWNKGHYSTCGR
ncbi:MYND-type domain-containing protein [Trichonephila inaurata madagascariensis]|uniref:MYND-type domain-containing protein n=1 Tax=Trichonephila inaurata madagascariensis TaxID=2747483 RepID=A0A8X6XTM9_9ARAC|nr:MYND-type domain-containing protein [Trichonephila inaurata madagascariensis]